MSTDNCLLTEEERLDLESRRYVDAARIIGPLCSGRYVVSAMRRGAIVALLTEAELPSAIVEACRRSTAEHEAALQEEAASSRRQAEPVSTASLEELGL